MCGHVAPSLPGIDPPGRAGSLVSFQGKAFAHFFNETVWLCFPGHTGAYNTKAPGESACLAATHSEGSGCVSRNPFFVSVSGVCCAAHVAALFSHLHTPGGALLFERGYF